MSTNPTQAPAQKTVRLKVKYDELKALYASQAIVNCNGEEIFLDFSSGILADPSSGDSLLPIHTRIAMTPQGAGRLIQALQQALTGKGAPVKNDSTDSSSLPRLS